MIWIALSFLVGLVIGFIIGSLWTPDDPELDRIKDMNMVMK